MLHWRSKVGAFHRSLLDRITPSMRACLDLPRIWEQAVKQAELELGAYGRSAADNLPRQCPLDIEAMLDKGFDLIRTADAVRQQIGAAVPQK